MSNLAHLCKERIAKTGYAEFIGQLVHVESISDSGEARFCCVVHEESTSSASFNVNSGLWKCHSANCGASGDIIDFFQAVRGIATKGETIHQLAVALKLIENITEGMVEAFAERLQDKSLATAMEWFGVSEAALRYFRIGITRQDDKSFLTIPIRGGSGHYEDIRRYNKNYKPKIKHWADGHGAVRVFPYESLGRFKSYVVMEGEKDTMRAIEFGIENAICFTGGAGSLPDDAVDLFKGAALYLCYDIDTAGREGVEKIGRRLAAHVNGIYDIRLPGSDMPANGDFSDWANLGYTMADWETLVFQAVKIEPVGGQFNPEVSEDAPRAVLFSEIRNATDLYGIPIRFLGHAMGCSVGLQNYQVPTEVLLDCPQNKKKMCETCACFGMDLNRRPWVIPVNYRSEASLQMFRVSEEQQGQAVRRLLSINRRCDALKIATTKRRPVQHLLVSPPVELSAAREYEAGGFLTAYYHGEPVTDNRDYWFTGFLQADPKTQSAVLNLHQAEPARNVIEHFTVTEDTFAAIDSFRPKAGRTIDEHFREMHRMIESHIGIWGQYGLQHAFLESIFSVIEFSVGDRRVENGWVEVLIIGDTGLAKTTVGRRIMEMVNVGELISGENVTAAGLIGGVEQVDKISIVKWGALPRNNGGFVILDEIEEMQRKGGKDITGQLTALRSSGWAEVTKIVNSRAPARVRMVWITNPTEARRISSFNGGCRAIETVIRGRADVARFTKAYSVASDNISVETITQDRARETRAELCRHLNTLAILTWSLKHDQVRFTPESHALLKRETIRLTNKYHESIPLLEKGRAFDKLAKLSVPVAALSGSFVSEGDTLTLLIDALHVQYAIQHLEGTYDDPAMGYDTYSAVEYERQEIVDETLVRNALLTVHEVSTEAVLRYFLTHSTFSRNGLDELMGNRTAAYDLWSKLLANNCLTTGHRADQAVKTPAFAGLVERLIGDLKNGKAHKIDGQFFGSRAWEAANERRN